MEYSVTQITTPQITTTQKITDINSLIKLLETNIQDNENSFFKDIVQAQIAIFKFLKDPEFGIHLVDSTFEYIEKAIRKAQNEPNNLSLIKEQATDSIRALITIQHAFVLLAYRAKEQEAKDVLEAGVETLIHSTRTIITGFSAIDIPHIVINDIVNSNHNIFQKFISWIFARKEYERKRKQFIWILHKILEKVYRQRHLFEHTSSFKEVIYTALALLDKYKLELLTEKLEKFKENFSGLEVIFIMLAIIWMVFLISIYLFSWIPSMIFNLSWAATALNWIKVNFKISLIVGVLLFLTPSLIAKIIYWKEKLQFYFFKRKILKLIDA